MRTEERAATTTLTSTMRDRRRRSAAVRRLAAAEARMGPTGAPRPLRITPSRANRTRVAS